MKLVNRCKLTQAALLVTGAFFVTVAPGIQSLAVAQDYSAPPSFAPRQLDDLVSRIALYPDPLLAQIFAAASFPDQIPDAARWANQNQNLRGNELADAIYESNLQFDPAVQALIPFPAVLDMMARDMEWTSQLGEAVLADRRDVMDSVQRMRRTADQYGYLQSNQQMRVANDGYGIAIEPVNPSLIYVPVYDPYVVYAAPRPGFFTGGAIRIGSCYSIGAFAGWGWGGGFNWVNHSVYVNRAAWGRTWNNRAAYTHDYGNWDRGAWRNNYANRNVTVYNNRTVYRNDNVYRSNNNYSNSGRDYRGVQQGVQQAPVVQDRYNGRNSGRQFSNSGYGNTPAAPMAPAAPVMDSYRQSRDAYRTANGGAYRNADMYRGGQSAQVAQPAPAVNTYQQNPNRDAYRNANANRDGSNFRNPGMYRGAQSAPAAPAAPVDQNRSFTRNSYSQPAANNAPAAQGRTGREERGMAQGRMEHNGGGRR